MYTHTVISYCEMKKISDPDIKTFHVNDTFLTTSNQQILQSESETSITMRIPNNHIAELQRTALAKKII